MDFAQKYDAFFVFMRGTLHITPFWRESFEKKHLPSLDLLAESSIPSPKIIVLTEQKPSGGTGFFWGKSNC